MGPTRIEKYFEKQKRKAARELASSFPDENNAQKKRWQPAAKKKSKGGARVSDQGADLHGALARRARRAPSRRIRGAGRGPGGEG
jgi:hypothetical protein